MMRLGLQTLSSVFIMKIPDTDFYALIQKLEDAPVEAALPSHLSDELLMQIGRDLRMADSAYESGDDVEAHTNAAGWLVLHLLCEHASKLCGKPALELMLERLDRWVSGQGHWVKRYRHYIELEIVSRAIHIPGHRHTNALLAEIEDDIRNFG